MNTIIRKALRLGVFAVAGLLALFSCTDKWDEHYGEMSSETFEGTLVEYLEGQSEQLSDFMEVLKATGYDINLGSDQMFTVWVPVNGSFDKEALLAEIQNGGKERVINRFLRNHIALYSVSLTPNEQDVTLQNSKVIRLSGAAEAKFGNCDIIKYNVVCKNGVFNIIASENVYVPTIFESLEDDYNEYLAANPSLNPDEMISLMSYLKAFDDDSLDEAKSVFKGLDLNGNRVYVDSVMIRNNTRLREVDALLYEEDSTYWAIIPSVEAYKARYDEAWKYLNFNPSANTADDPDYVDSLRNHYANIFAMRDLFYNMNANVYYTDSLKSTEYSAFNWEEHVYRGDPFGSDGILANAEVVECSNGNVYKVNEYPISIYDQFFKKNSTTLWASSIEKDDKYTKNCKDAYMYSGVYKLPTLDENGDTISVENVVWSALNVEGSSSKVQPQVTFKLYNTLSGKYNLKLVMVPTVLKSNYDVQEGPVASANNLKNKFRMTLFQKGEDGNFARGTNLTKPGVSGTAARNFESHAFDGQNPIDTVDICEIELDHCYYGTGESGVMLQVASYVTSSDLKKGYTRDLLLQKIILEPVRE